MKKFTEIARRAFQCNRHNTSILFVKSSRKTFAVALLILAVATTAQSVRAETVVGKISSVKGTVKIVRGGKTLMASKGMAIRLHDEVVTGADGSVTIVMPDHNLLHLDRSGSLFIGRGS
jgi:hypothetical protein